MEARYKKMGAQLGRKTNYGTVIPHVVSGVLRKRRAKKSRPRETVPNALGTGGQAFLPEQE